MKDLKDYLIEQSKSPFDEAIDYAYEWLDYMHNEGVVDYNEKAIMRWIQNKEKPDYKDFAKGILDTLKGMSKKTKELIEKYLETGKERKFEEAVNAAIAKFYSENSEYLEKYA